MKISRLGFLKSLLGAGGAAAYVGAPGRRFGSAAPPAVTQAAAVPAPAPMPIYPYGLHGSFMWAYTFGPGANLAFSGIDNRPVPRRAGMVRRNGFGYMRESAR